MNPSFLDVLKFCGEWYTVGVVLAILFMLYRINISKTLDEIKVTDIQDLFMIALAGPLLFLFALGYFGFNFWSEVKLAIDQHKNTVLWRSKRGKTKTVLYGSKDDDDD